MLQLVSSPTIVTCHFLLSLTIVNYTRTISIVKATALIDDFLRNNYRWPLNKLKKIFLGYKDNNEGAGLATNNSDYAQQGPVLYIVNDALTE